MEQINYFENCSNIELMKLWEAYKVGDIVSKGTPFRPYLDQYANSPSKTPLVLCEIDFLKTCAKRFYEQEKDILAESRPIPY